MTNQNLYLDINILQTVPSSNINRDDTGSPKTALYGGVSRARVSSQSWKRSVRQGFKDANVITSVRSKKAALLLVEQLMKLDDNLTEKEALDKATAVFNMAGIKLNKDTHETGALLMVSHGQIEKLAQYALNGIPDDKEAKKEIKTMLQGNQSLDLALFGRMVADNPELNVDASAQVAHAISTHEVVSEYDYFTALDDLQPKDTAGAAMLGSLEFNSATLYRYANVNIAELCHNLGNEDAVTGAVEFVKQFVITMPSGKQNTFANKTLPNYVMVSVRTDTPVNLVSAFEEPVKSRNGYVEKSIIRLEEEYTSTQQYVEKPMLSIALSKFDTHQGEKVNNLSELLQKVTDGLKKAIQHEDIND